MSTILIVDDSIFSRGVIRSTLEQAGFSTIESDSGKNIIDLHNEYKPICITLDLLMPEVTGRNVLEILKKENITTPVIIISSDVQESTKADCVQLGAKAFLNKPPQPDELISTIKNITNTDQD